METSQLQQHAGPESVRLMRGAPPKGEGSVAESEPPAPIEGAPDAPAAPEASNVSPELQRVRAELRGQTEAIGLTEMSRRLGTSRRSLQRALMKAGACYRHEQLEARFAAACEMLVGSDLKVSAIAAKLGVTERSLTKLFRSRGEPPPMASRRRMRMAIG